MLVINFMCNFLFATVVDLFMENLIKLKTA